MVKNEYKDYFIAFLDILGFKHLIDTDSCDEIYSIFEELHKKSATKLNCNGVEIAAFKYIHYRILSDSIILFIDAAIEDSFAALLFVCGKLQMSLANKDKPILMRGGIVKGELFYQQDIIYGKGLTKAYLLESNLAKYPRIIFTGETLKSGNRTTKYMFTEMDSLAPCYKMDEDYLYHVDYFLYHHGGATIDEQVEYYDRLLSLCTYWLNKEIDSSLRDKYLWLKKHIEESINRHCNIREIFQKRRSEQIDCEINDYNDKFSVFIKE